MVLCAPEQDFIFKMLKENWCQSLFILNLAFKHHFDQFTGPVVVKMVDNATMAIFLRSRVLKLDK